MKSNTCRGRSSMLAVGYRGVLAQTPAPTQFSGVINDYSPLNEHPDGSVGNARSVDFDVERRYEHRPIFRRP